MNTCLTKVGCDKGVCVTMGGKGRVICWTMVGRYKGYFLYYGRES